MNGNELKRWGWGAGCVALGLVGCGPNTTDFETPGSGGTAGTADNGNGTGGGSTVSGGTSAETSGASGETGGTGGTAVETSGTGSAGGAAIWPELPTQRGTVADLEPYDFEASFCCSRAPEHPESPDCPQGADHRWTAAINEIEEDIHEYFSGTPATNEVPFYVFSAENTTPMDLYLWETELDPPEGILALSPIYWIGASGAFPLVTVRVPFTTNQEVPLLDPFTFIPPENGKSMLYFSADGLVYERFAGSINYQMSGEISEPGFLFVGAQADEWTCEASGGEGGAAGE